MKVHSSGNIFTSGPGGLLVISPEGELKASIDFGHITNCAFDEEEEYLYATGFVNNPKVFRLKTSALNQVLSLNSSKTWSKVSSYFLSNSW